jgi:lysophospholipase L1-like esterase
MTVLYSYNDAAINSSCGRKTDYGTSNGSGWQGSQWRFKVSGTLNLIVNANCTDSGASDYCGLSASIDFSDTSSDVVLGDPRLFTTLAETATNVNRTATLAVPTTGEHTVILKLWAYPTPQYDQTSHTRLISVEVDNGGTVTPWVQNGGRRTMGVGDSHMGAFADWFKFLNPLKYWPYMVSFGGASAATLDAQFNYDYSTVLNNSDPTVDLVINNTSENDWIGSVTLAAFQTSLDSLVVKQRAKQPTAKIVLLQAPRNATAGKDFDKYGPSMANVAAAHANVHYIPVTAATWDTLTWNADTYHLDFAGQKLYAAFVETKLDLLYPKKNRAMVIA